MRFLLKLSPEIIIKSTSVRKTMTKILADNVRRLAEKDGIACRVRRFWDKIEVEVADEDGARLQRRLCDTPGIDLVLRVRELPLSEVSPQAVAQAVAAVAAPWVAGKTFAVRAKRKGRHAFTSLELERAAGAALLAAAPGAKVDLTHPEVTVAIELAGDVLELVEARERGLGGFPLGAQGEAIALVSGGFDSSVAAFLMLRRGIKTHFVFFDLGGAEHEAAVQQVCYYLWQRYARSHPVLFVSVPFGEVIERLLSEVREGYMGVMLKRLMLMAASRLADELGLDALVTGESLAQVSSQTLRNLALIDRATDKLVVRPVVALHKNEIIAWAERIGTRSFAEHLPEHCAVISKRPVIHGSFERLAELERNFDFTVLDRALAARKTWKIEALATPPEAGEALPVVTRKAPGELLIDIRPPELADEAPLPEADLVIPFFALREAVLPEARRYLLYCDRGLLSQWHGRALAARGLDVAVYQPGRSP